MDSGAAELNPAFLPYEGDKFSAYGRYRDMLDSAFSAELRGAWVRRARRSTLESLRRSIIVKSVRSQLCLAAIANEFNVPIVHLARDPRSVVASILRNGWGRTWLTNLSLEDQLLHAEDSRTEYFGQWTDLIRQSDRGAEVTKLATYWALLERHVEDIQLKLSNSILLLRYEDLLSGPDANVRKVLEKLGVRQLDLGSDQSSIPSPTAIGYGERMNLPARRAPWKEELCANEVRQIEEVACELGFEKYLKVD